MLPPESNIKSINTQDASEYLGATKKAEDIQKSIDDAGNMNFFNAIGSTIGLEYFFTTFANSTAWAASKDQETTGFAGSFAVAINNTVSKAILEDNSNVIFKSQNNNGNTLKVDAYTNNQVWSGSGNVDILPETIATVGENVEVTQDNSNYGDVIVKAFDETDDINVAASNGNADETGIAGAISISAIVDGQVKASIESSAEINARDILVDANKDLTHVNGNLGIAKILYLSA